VIPPRKLLVLETLSDIFSEIVHTMVNKFLDAIFEEQDDVEILLYTKTQKCNPVKNSRTLSESLISTALNSAFVDWSRRTQVRITQGRKIGKRDSFLFKLEARVPIHSQG
jgi:hypothetical protein